MKVCNAKLPLVCMLIFAYAADHAHAQPAQIVRPNIVLIFPDNLGWGEVGVYGSVRGVPTPRIDQIATQGMRTTNARF